MNLLESTYTNNWTQCSLKSRVCQQNPCELFVQKIEGESCVDEPHSDWQSCKVMSLPCTGFLSKHFLGLSLFIFQVSPFFFPLSFFPVQVEVLLSEVFCSLSTNELYWDFLTCHATLSCQNKSFCIQNRDMSVNELSLVVINNERARIRLKHAVISFWLEYYNI